MHYVHRQLGLMHLLPCGIQGQYWHCSSIMCLCLSISTAMYGRQPLLDLKWRELLLAINGNLGNVFERKPADKPALGSNLGKERLSIVLRRTSKNSHLRQYRPWWRVCSPSSDTPHPTPLALTPLPPWLCPTPIRPDLISSTPSPQPRYNFDPSAKQ